MIKTSVIVVRPPISFMIPISPDTRLASHFVGQSSVFLVSWFAILAVFAGVTLAAQSAMGVAVAPSSFWWEFPIIRAGVAFRGGGGGDGGGDLILN